MKKNAIKAFLGFHDVKTYKIFKLLTNNFTKSLNKI